MRSLGLSLEWLSSGVDVDGLSLTCVDSPLENYHERSVIISVLHPGHLCQPVGYRSL